MRAQPPGGDGFAGFGGGASIAETRRAGRRRPSASSAPSSAVSAEAARWQFRRDYLYRLPEWAAEGIRSADVFAAITLVSRKHR